MITKLLFIFMLISNVLGAREMSSQDFSAHINQLRSQISTSAANGYILHAYTSQLITQISEMRQITTPHRNYSVDLEWAADVIARVNNETEPARRQVLLMNMVDTLEGLANEIEYAGEFSGVSRSEMNDALQRAIDKTVRVRVARYGSTDRQVSHTTRGGYVMEGAGEEISLSTAEAVDKRGRPVSTGQSSSTSRSSSSSGFSSQSQSSAWYNSSSAAANQVAGSAGQQQGSQSQSQVQSQSEQQQSDPLNQSQQKQPHEQQQGLQPQTQGQAAQQQGHQPQMSSQNIQQQAQQHQMTHQSAQQQPSQQSPGGQANNPANSTSSQVRRPKPPQPAAPIKPPPPLPKPIPPKLPPLPATAGLFYYLFMGLVIIGVIVTIVITIIKFLTKVKEGKENDHISMREDELPPEQLTTDTLLDKAMRAAAKENYHEAIRLLTIGALIILEHQQVISYKDSLTNGEYLKRLLVEKELHAKFKKPMTVFDKLIYGFQQPNRQDFYMFRDFYLDLENMQR